ncbi:MAG: hypothetical protein AAF357_03040 [Verrucomicrobiota bacterium]
MDLLDALKFSRTFPENRKERILSTFRAYEKDVLEAISDYSVQEAFFHLDDPLSFSEGGEAFRRTAVSVFHNQEVTGARSSGFVDQLEIILERDSDDLVRFVSRQVFYPFSKTEERPLNRPEV